MGIKGFAVGWSRRFDLFQIELVQIISQRCLFHLSISILTFSSAKQHFNNSEQSFLVFQSQKPWAHYKPEKSLFLGTVNESVECSNITCFVTISSVLRYSGDVIYFDLCHIQIVQITVINMDHNFCQMCQMWWISAQTYANLMFENQSLGKNCFIFHWSKTHINLQPFQIFKVIYYLKSPSWLHGWW